MPKNNHVFLKSFCSRISTKMASSFLALSILGGCAIADPSLINAEMPNKKETLNVGLEDPIIVLESSPNEFWTVDYDKGDKIPDVYIGPISAKNVEISDFFKEIGSLYDIGIIESGEIKDRKISYVDSKPRLLGDVIDQMSDRVGVFYHYKNHLLSFEDEKRFFVRVPRIEGSLDLIASALSELGATSLVVDDITGVISFKADARVYKDAQSFMKKFEFGREMIVYDIWIFERTLNKARKAGIHWDEFGGTFGDFDLSLGNSTSSAGNINFGVVRNPGALAIDALFSFLNQEGASETVSRPQVAMMSGGESQFEVGEKIQYIERVSVEKDDITGETEQGVDVSTLEVGIKVDITGAHSDGIINTKMELRLNQLIRFQDFDTGDVQLSLPQTADRSITTTLDARPGDLIMIGGLIQDRLEQSGDNLIVDDIPLNRSKDVQKSETIIVMRPRLVKIRPNLEDLKSNDRVEAEERIVPSNVNSIKIEMDGDAKISKKEEIVDYPDYKALNDSDLDVFGSDKDIKSKEKLDDVKEEKSSVSDKENKSLKDESPAINLFKEKNMENKE